MESRRQYSKEEIEKALNKTKAQELEDKENAKRGLISMARMSRLALRDVIHTMLKTDKKNNAIVALSSNKLGELYHSFFYEELENKLIDSIELDNDFRSDPKLSNDIENGHFRSVQGIANKLGRERRKLGELMDELGIAKRDGAYRTSDVLLLKKLYDECKNHDARVELGRKLRRTSRLEYLTVSDIKILESKKLSKSNRKTGIFD